MMTKFFNSIIAVNRISQPIWIIIISFFLLIYQNILKYSQFNEFNTLTIASILALVSLLFSGEIFRKWINPYLYKFALILITLLMGLSVQYFELFPVQVVLISLGLLVFSLELRLLVTQYKRKEIMAELFFAVIISLSLLVIFINFYDVDFQSPFFIEKILLGEAHIDTMFHITIANNLENYNIGSLGLNGLDHNNYHYGSHALFANWSRLIGIKPIEFYNILYPIIIIPFFIHTLFSLTKNIISKYYKGYNSHGLILILILLVHTLQFSLFANMFNGESTIFSIILVYLLLCFLIDLKEIRFIHILITIFWLVNISITKVSSAFLIICPLSLFYLIRRKFNYREYLILIVIGLGLAYFLLNTFIPLKRLTQDEVSLLKRLINITSKGFISTFLPFLILPFFTSHITTKKIAELYKSDQIIFLVGIGLSTIGVLFLVSSNYNDVLTFVKTQNFYTLPLIITFLFLILSRLKQKSIVTTITLMTLLGSIFFNGELTYKADSHRIIYKKHKELKLSKNIPIMEMVYKINELNLPKDNVIFYIPQTETWFHDSQNYRKIGSNFVFQSLTSYPLLLSISNYVLENNEKRYGFGYYSDINTNFQSDPTDAKVKLKALNMEFEKVYKITRVDSKINIKQL